ncbi:MAG: methyltransferase domain-containing protein [Chthoniobacterales bacterium]|nr:methyltransferase domain-containing protein [Chthoniobacterales bacterium]
MLYPLRRAFHRRIPGEIDCFPPIDTDLEEFRPYLRGRVLNAGAGVREVSHLVDGELINQDITWAGDERTNIQIYSPLHFIPVANDHFDAILCIAVLEHVENPQQVMAEMFRVLKSGGHLVLEVPFLQPEHKVPTDFQRYTRDGLERLVADNGFRVVRTRGLFTVYHTLYWQAHIWLHTKRTPLYLLGRLIVLPMLLRRARRSTTYNERMATGYQILATK